MAKPQCLIVPQKALLYFTCLFETLISPCFYCPDYYNVFFCFSFMLTTLCVILAQENIHTYINNPLGVVISLYMRLLQMIAVSTFLVFQKAVIDNMTAVGTLNHNLSTLEKVIFHLNFQKNLFLWPDFENFLFTSFLTCFNAVVTCYNCLKSARNDSY
jgi:hypothetical protein